MVLLGGEGVTVIATGRQLSGSSVAPPLESSTEDWGEGGTLVLLIPLSSVRERRGETVFK